jgi:acetyl-CoA acetyltransferase
VPLQQLAFYQHYNTMMMMAVFIMKANGTTRERFNNFWATIQQL